MATVADFITDALEITGLQTPNETITADKLSVGLKRINGIIDKWNVSKLRGFSQTDVSFPLTPGVAEYTIGPGGDFDTDRPVKIVHMFVRDPLNQQLDYRVNSVSYDEYNDISLKTISSFWPRWFYYNPGFPLGTIKFYPVPSQTYNVFITEWFMFGNFTTTGDTVALPTGYEELLTYELATKLCSHFGKAVPLDVKETYKEIDKKITILNSEIWKVKMVTTSPTSNRGGSKGDQYRTFIPRAFG